MNETALIMLSIPLSSLYAQGPIQSARILVDLVEDSCTFLLQSCFLARTLTYDCFNTRFQAATIKGLGNRLDVAINPGMIKDLAVSSYWPFDERGW